MDTFSLQLQPGRNGCPGSLVVSKVPTHPTDAHPQPPTRHGLRPAPQTRLLPGLGSPVCFPSASLHPHLCVLIILSTTPWIRDLQQPPHHPFLQGILQTIRQYFIFFLNYDVTVIATPACKSSVVLHFLCTKGLCSMYKSLSVLALAYQPHLLGTKSSSPPHPLLFEQKNTHNSPKRPYILSELIHPQHSGQGGEGHAWSGACKYA